VGVEDLRAGLERALAHEVDQPRHRLALVHGVDDHALEARHETDSLYGLLVNDAVDAGVPSIKQDNLVVGEFATEFDGLRRALGDALDLPPSLFDGGWSVDADDVLSAPGVREAPQSCPPGSNPPPSRR
jgi:hypothetical protein